jgi:hypothetical protein
MLFRCMSVPVRRTAVYDDMDQVDVIDTEGVSGLGGGVL